MANDFFIKDTPNADEEVRGLVALAELGKIRIVRAISNDDRSITLERIENQRPNKEFWQTFGRQLAEMHSLPQNYFGFEFDNHIGATKQPNPKIACEKISWADYFIKHRLEHMLAQPRLKSNEQLQDLFNEYRPLIRERLLEVTEPPCLVHGDLWSGNFICAEGEGPDLQVPVLIDPAPYSGHREVDLSMSELFGGFSPDFYQAYEQQFPLQSGYASRKDIYNLYHLLNHWVIFGDSYASQTLRLFLRLDFTSED